MLTILIAIWHFYLYGIIAAVIFIILSDLFEWPSGSINILSALTSWLIVLIIIDTLIERIKWLNNPGYLLSFVFNRKKLIKEAIADAERLYKCKIGLITEIVNDRYVVYRYVIRTEYRVKELDRPETYGNYPGIGTKLGTIRKALKKAKELYSVDHNWPTK